MFLSVRAIKRGICFGTNSNGSSSNRLVRCTYDSFGNQHQEPYSDAAQERATTYTYGKESRVVKIVYPYNQQEGDLLGSERLHLDWV